MLNGPIPPATPIVAKVTKITSGRSPYAVCVAEGVARSITFSLNREVWRSDELPNSSFRGEVLLWDIRPYPQGWRAHGARYSSTDNYRPIEHVSNSNSSKSNSKGATMEDNEARRQQLANRLKWVGWLGAVLVFGILMPLILKGLLGMLALGVGAVGGYIFYKMWPVFAMKVANRQIKGIIEEAEDNPIETMENLRIEKATELSEADNNIVEFETEIGNYDDQLDSFKSQYPEEADHYQEVSDKMHEALVDMKREQSAARKELGSFEQQIKKAKAIYKMSLAAQKVVKLSKSAEAQVFAQIKEQVAFDTVRAQLNRSFANLNLALERRRDTRTALPGVKAAASLPEGRPTEVIDVTPARERAPVARK